MAIGLVEYIVIEFPGNQFRGEIIPALKQLVSNGLVRVIDLIEIKKDADGRVQWFEANQPGGDEEKLWDEIDGEVDDLVNAEDIQLVAQSLTPNSIAGLLVWEDTWATQFADAVRTAHGRVVAHERIPNHVVQAATDAPHAMSTQRRRQGFWARSSVPPTQSRRLRARAAASRRVDPVCCCPRAVS